MTREPGDRRPSEGLGARSDQAQRREVRLAAALRTNLKRRKDQRRERGTPDTPGPEPVASRDPETDVL